MTALRKLQTARRVRKEKGWKGVSDLLRLMWWRQQKSVRLEDCKFSLSCVRDDMRAALFNGIYEFDERLAIRNHLPQHLPVVELGACIGVVACVSNKLLKSPSHHVVVEANPRLIPDLEANRAFNRCSFSIVNKAIAYGTNSVTFEPAWEPWASRIDGNSTSSSSVTVPATSLADILRDFDFSTFSLICDIEGHEYDLVKHEGQTLCLADTLILETHSRFIGEAKNEELLQNLRNLGFDTVAVYGNVCVLKNSARNREAG